MRYSVNPGHCQAILAEAEDRRLEASGQAAELMGSLEHLATLLTAPELKASVKRVRDDVVEAQLEGAVSRWDASVQAGRDAVSAHVVGDRETERRALAALGRAADVYARL